MIFQARGLQGFNEAAVPDGFQALIQAVQSETIPPKDARVKSLWVLLRQRQLLNHSPWLKAALQHIWGQGLSARPRPRTAQRLVRHLRQWQPGRPVAVQPVGTARSLPTPPIQPESDRREPHNDERQK
jgi:hypothetical protein